MPMNTLRMLTVAMLAAGFCASALAAQPRPRHAHKVNRLASPRAAQPVLDPPGQTTVLTRQMLDDINATSLRDALRSTAGVTVR
jgi:outer membrane receptor for monomeric catechols